MKEVLRPAKQQGKILKRLKAVSTFELDGRSL
jgi:hypothetical protein